MPLLATLGLTMPKSRAAGGAAPDAPPDVDAGRSAAKSGHAPVAEVVEGEAQVVVVRKESLGKLRWERRYKGELFAFTDASGALVRGGPRAGWRAMSTANLYGARVVAAVTDLDRDERRWRELAERVHKGTETGAALARKAQAAAVAIKERKAKDAEFREAMRDYFRQFSEIQKFAFDVQSADAEFNEKLSHLAGVVTEGKIEEQKGKVADIQGEIDQIKADIEQAKAIFSKVLSIGTEIRNFAVKPSVDGLIGQLSEGVTALAGVIIEGQYAGRLGALDAQLAAAGAELKRLKNERFKHAVNEAQAALAGAVARCKRAEVVFHSAVDELANKQATASDEANEQKGKTGVIAEVIAGRARQRQAIAELRAAATAYIKLLDGVAVGVAKLTGHYAHVGDWIDDIAVADARLARGSAWANTAERAATANAVLLGNWTAFLPSARGDCQKALKATEGAASAAAMAPYEEALKTVNAALGQAA